MKQKGTLMTGIMDAVTQINELSQSIAKEIKEHGCLTIAEQEYIKVQFSQMTKDAQDAMDKVRGLFAIKSKIDEEEQGVLLTSLNGECKEHLARLMRFKSGVAVLLRRRVSLQKDIKEVARLFEKRGKKVSNEKVDDDSGDAARS